MTVADARVLFILLAARKASSQLLYAWGGEDIDEGGMDCSGLVSEVLRETARAYPSLYDGQRRTAEGIAGYYAGRGVARKPWDDVSPPPGALCFFGKPRIYHIKIHLCVVPDIELDAGLAEVGPLAIDSGGAGSDATNPRTALLRAAGVRLSASDWHGQSRAQWLDPFETVT